MNLIDDAIGCNAVEAKPFVVMGSCVNNKPTEIIIVRREYQTLSNEQKVDILKHLSDWVYSECNKISPL
jgi:hypothetical protein